jgi:hypothetical protein
MCENSSALPSTHFLIRSADRENYWETTASDFTINLQRSLKGSKAQISYLQLPVNYY